MLKSLNYYSYSQKKTTMVWLPDGEKKLENVFTRFDTIHERDRHPDR